MEADKLFYSVPGACDVLSLGRTQVYKLIAAGDLTVTKLGSRSLIHRSELERFAEQLRSNRDPHQAA